MRLHLVQHGGSVTKDVDPDRPLSDEGRNDVARVAGLLKPHNISAKVGHSGKTRAMQTAEVLSASLAIMIDDKKNADVMDGLAPNDDVVQFMKIPIVEKTLIDKDVMFVGHLPFMSKLASFLLTGDEGSGVVQFSQGGVLCLNKSENDGWSIQWMRVPSIVA